MAENNNGDTYHVALAIKLINPKLPFPQRWDPSNYAAAKTIDTASFGNGQWNWDAVTNDRPMEMAMFPAMAWPTTELPGWTEELLVEWHKELKARTTKKYYGTVWATAVKNHEIDRTQALKLSGKAPDDVMYNWCRPFNDFRRKAIKDKKLSPSAPEMITAVYPPDGGHHPRAHKFVVAPEILAVYAEHSKKILQEGTAA